MTSSYRDIYMKVTPQSIWIDCNTNGKINVKDTFYAFWLHYMHYMIIKCMVTSQVYEEVIEVSQIQEVQSRGDSTD